MASIRKRTLKSGKQVWVVDYKDQHDERRNKNFSRKKEAEAYVEEVSRQLRDGTFVHDKATCTVSEAADLYLGSASVRALEPGTQNQYDQHIRLYIKPHLGHVLLTKLTEPMIREFLDDIVEEIRKKNKDQVSRADIESAVRRVGVDFLLSPITDYIYILHGLNGLAVIGTLGLPFFLFWIF